MSSITAAPHAAEFSKSLLSIFVPKGLKRSCVLEGNSVRNEKGRVSFGNQPENPARGYNSAKGNIPYLYITCQEVLPGRAKNIHPPNSLAKSIFPIWQFPTSDLTPFITISNLKFQISNCKSESSTLNFKLSNPKFQIQNAQHQTSNLKFHIFQISDFKPERSNLHCKLSNLKFQISNFKFKMPGIKRATSNLKFQISNLKLPSPSPPHPGGSPCVTQS
jgi:hypothetical protein